MDLPAALQVRRCSFDRPRSFVRCHRGLRANLRLELRTGSVRCATNSRLSRDGIFYISNMFEVSLMRLRNFWLDLVAAKKPDVQRVRDANASIP